MPSSLDIKTWRKISKKAKTDSNILIFGLVVFDEILFVVFNKKGKCTNKFKFFKKEDNDYKIL